MQPYLLSLVYHFYFKKYRAKNYFQKPIDKQYYMSYNIVKVTKRGDCMSFPLSSGLLDACVLAVLNRSDTYGYALTQQIMSTTDISESTLYPVLRRLQKDGHLTTYDQPENGRNRRFYAITDSGRIKLSEYLIDWHSFKNNLNTILLGGAPHE